MKKTQLLLLSIFIMISFVVACEKDNEEVSKTQIKEDSHSQEESNKQEQLEEDYISATVTGYNNGVNADNGMTTQIWHFDPDGETTKKVFDFETSAQYSLGYFDRKNNVVYYVKRVHTEDSYGDQIFTTDLKTGIETQLTDQLFAVNRIIPVEDQIFIVAARKNEREDKLGSIDKKTNEITFWRKDEDNSVASIAVDKINKKVFISAFSMADRDESFKTQGNGNYQMEKYTIYQVDYDLQNTKEIFAENWHIRSIMTNGEKITALADKKYNNSKEPSMIYEYNIKTGESALDTWTAQRLRSHSSDYSSDGKKIYGISIVDEHRGIAAYDVESQQMELLVDTIEGNFINNIHVVKNEIKKDN
ncbi:hypothetical protein [Chengkuizengella axinellae]|uniref:Lipoprotein n=1 Tax=Chengkuizengella axinellae TaxID=3064388 RepID=A0ABT9J621_9BACL|nr:hypothetical protein [Chengkuizengella sp. 2205SS18-9]MDP5277072.1 hypothetical protein [Chengkuizengella sp. 2205SS18-9]